MSLKDGGRGHVLAEGVKPMAQGGLGRAQRLASTAVPSVDKLCRAQLSPEERLPLLSHGDVIAHVQIGDVQVLRLL